MDKETLTLRIKDFALSEAGFDLVGICAASELTEDRVRMRQWLDLGRAAGMGYLSRAPENRLDPRKALPNAQSVICLAVNYFHEMPACPATARCGRVARYAHGSDYHSALKERAQKLADHIGSLTDKSFAYKIFVDSGPLAEKAFAREAGIGFYGRHSLLISRHYGSWIFLAALVTNLDLTHDQSETADCGDCRRCVEACPTGAICEDYQLDAGRCLSYWTVESRQAALPADIAGRLGDRVFGCDVCQEVCPKNAGVQVTTHAEFVSTAGAAAWLDLGDVMRLSEAGFNDRFADSVIGRLRAVGLRRNASAVLKGLK